MPVPDAVAEVAHRLEVRGLAVVEALARPVGDIRGNLQVVERRAEAVAVPVEAAPWELEQQRSPQVSLELLGRRAEGEEAIER